MTDTVLRFMFEPKVGIGFAWFFHAMWYGYGRRKGSKETMEFMHNQHRKDQAYMMRQLVWWRDAHGRERDANLQLYQENLRLRRSQRVIHLTDITET